MTWIAMKGTFSIMRDVHIHVESDQRQRIWYCGVSRDEILEGVRLGMHDLTELENPDLRY